MRKIARTSLLCAGTAMGAGLASGRELLSYFSVFSGTFAWVILAFMFLYAGIMYALMRSAKKLQAYTPMDLTAAAMGKYNKIFWFLPALSYLIVFAAMLAGADALQRVAMPGLKMPWLAAAMALGCAAAEKKGIDAVISINTVTALFATVAMLALSVSALIAPEGTFWTLMQQSRTEPASAAHYYRLGLYLCMNTFLAAGVVAPAAKSLSNKDMLLSSLGAAVMLGLVMLISGFALMQSDAVISRAQMPMMYIAVRLGYAAFAGFSIMMAVSVFTAMASSFYPLAGAMSRLTKSRFKATMSALAMGIILSRLGFTGAINALYPVMGVVSAVFIIMLIKNAEKSKGAGRALPAFRSAYVCRFSKRIR